jgi:hypothetical protein
MTFTRRGIFQAIGAAIVALKGKRNADAHPKTELWPGIPTAEKTTGIRKWFIPKIYSDEIPVYKNTNLGKAVLCQLWVHENRSYELFVFDGHSKEFSGLYAGSQFGVIHLYNLESLAQPKVQIKPSHIRPGTLYALLPPDKQPEVPGVFGVAQLGNGDIPQLGVLDLHGLKLPDGTIRDQRRWMAATVMGEGPELSLDGAPSDSVESWEGLPPNT